MKIRNFSIIAHIDHGKSTLADRFLEVTKTVEQRKMKDQILDRMDLEREKGITIKMKPVRMKYQYGGEPVILNLIDTPGHIDFAYEVSRALRAVEGSILLVDATQGIQAQTLTTLHAAQECNLHIMPVVTKIDAPLAQIEETSNEIVDLLGCKKEDISFVSGKTGEGVPALLDRLIKEVNPPAIHTDQSLQALVFDFDYSNHQGVVVFVRVVAGEVKRGDVLSFAAASQKFIAQEVGVFVPGETPKDVLLAGEIGYIVTGIKEPGIATVGDTIVREKNSAVALPGYRSPKPVVWASLYPEGQDNYDDMRRALMKLRLTDSSLQFEEESSAILGRGFRCGFLGMLHMEIIIERLKREFSLELIVTSPGIAYKVTYTDGHEETVYTPQEFPDDMHISEVQEPWVRVNILTPEEYTSPVIKLLQDHEGMLEDTLIRGGSRFEMVGVMPLRQLMRGFFDTLKSVSAGYASLSYEIIDHRLADVTRLDILVAEEVVPAFSRIVTHTEAEREGRKDVESLKEVMPKQLFVTKLQARVRNRIVASETMSAMKKNVTGHLYGGDITRKRKLWEKQKRGKKKMKELGKVSIPPEVFVKMIRRREK